MAISIRRKLANHLPIISEHAHGANALKPACLENEQLYQSLDIARIELERAVLNFNELTDDKAIDYASYDILAARARYSYLIQLAKEKKLSL